MEKKCSNNAPIARRLALFIENWTKITSNPVILETVKGYQIPFLESETFQVSAALSLPPSLSMSLEGILLAVQEIQ